MILREPVDLVIDGADFYRSIESASIDKLRNGWCDFARLALQQAKESIGNPELGKVLYFDPRSKGRIEKSYGSKRRRSLWSDALKRSNVFHFLVSEGRDCQDSKADPDWLRKATQGDFAYLLRQEFSPNVLVLSSKASPLVSYMQFLQDRIGFAKGMLLPPGGSDPGGLTHDELEEFRLRGAENDVGWDEYRKLKQDGHLIETLWSRWRAEIHEAVQKRMPTFGETRYQKFLSCLEQDPAREPNFLTRAETDLRPFLDAIRRENKRLADNPECARFCLHRVVREVANAERSRICVPVQQNRVHRWVVGFHDGYRRDTENWPLDVRSELEEKYDLLRECGSDLAAPLVTALEGVANLKLKRMRLYEGGGAYRIVFAHVRPGKILVLAGGKKGGLNDGRFYRDIKAIASSRMKGSA